MSVALQRDKRIKITEMCGDTSTFELWLLGASWLTGGAVDLFKDQTEKPKNSFP